MDAGVIAITAFISPFKSDRDIVRNSVHTNEFIEIYCKADLQVCEQRDVKGIYAKARRGEIKDFTGISSPYEPPSNPEIEIDTGIETLDVSVNIVLTYLEKKGIIKPV